MKVAPASSARNPRANASPVSAPDSCAPERWSAGQEPLLLRRQVLAVVVGVRVRVLSLGVAALGDLLVAGLLPVRELGGVGRLRGGALVGAERSGGRVRAVQRQPDGRQADQERDQDHPARVEPAQLGVEESHRATSWPDPASGDPACVPAGPVAGRPGRDHARCCGQPPIAGELQEHRLQTGAHRDELAQPDALHAEQPGDPPGVALALHQQGLAVGADGQARVRQHLRRRAGVGHGHPHRAHPVPDHVGDRPAGQQPPAADDRHGVGDLLDLGQDVAGDQDGAALVGQPAHRAADLVDPGRVQAVGRLVEDQQLRFLEQGGGDGQPLLHAQRVRLEQVAAAVEQAGGLEHLVHPSLRGADRPGEQAQVAPAAERREERRRLDDRAHPPGDLRQVARHRVVEHPDPAGVRADQTEQHADGRRLARAVGTEEAVHPAAGDAQVEAVDSHLTAVPGAIGLVQVARQHGVVAHRSPIPLGPVGPSPRP